MQIHSGIDENRSAIRSSKLFVSVGVTFAVVAVLVGVMMWFGQQHLGKLQAQVRPREQSEQTDAKRTETSPSAFAADKKQAAVEHCRAVQGINAWLVCMEREGVEIRELLKTGQ
jgi:flagellar biosynthesis/type III secretory pathway M-ring protein FliF/YscJ